LVNTHALKATQASFIRIISTVVVCIEYTLDGTLKYTCMEEFNLNYQHRYPRIEFSNGVKMFGVLWAIYNNKKRKMDYYFADSSEVRKLNQSNPAILLEGIRKLHHVFRKEEIVAVEYLN